VNDVDALQRGIMDYWGLCETGIIPSPLRQRCRNRDINIRDLVLYNLKTYPEVSNDQNDQRLGCLMSFGSPWVTLGQPSDDEIGDWKYWNIVHEPV
jgi:hypothetical protein